MRTNIDIDDDLMAAAMEAGGFKTKKDAVEEGLRLVSRRKVYEGLLALRGKLKWDDSDEAWAPARFDSTSAQAVREPAKNYGVAAAAEATVREAKSKLRGAPGRSKAK
jgi:antitoxin ParD1/3/4